MAVTTSVCMSVNIPLLCSTFHLEHSECLRLQVCTHPFPLAFTHWCQNNQLKIRNNHSCSFRSHFGGLVSCSRACWQVVCKAEPRTFYHRSNLSSPRCFCLFRDGSLLWKKTVLRSKVRSHLMELGSGWCARQASSNRYGRVLRSDFIRLHKQTLMVK